MIESHQYYDLELEGMRDIARMHEEDDHLRIARREDAKRKEAAFSLMQLTIDRLGEWEDYKEAVLRQVLATGNVPYNGLVFESSGKEFRVKRCGQISGGKLARLAITRKNYTISNNNETGLYMDYAKPGSKFHSEFLFYENGSYFKHDKFESFEAEYSAALNFINSL